MLSAFLNKTLNKSSKTDSNSELAHPTSPAKAKVAPATVGWIGDSEQKESKKVTILESVLTDWTINCVALFHHLQGQYKTPARVWS